MKRLSYLLVIAALVFASCSKAAVPGIGEATAGSPAIEAPATGEGASGRPAYIMLQGLSLWTKDGDSAVWAKSATLADPVEILGEPVELEYRGAKRDYTRILMSDGFECYARSPYVLEAAKLAVVTSDKCVIYNEPRIIGATTSDIPYLAVVAVLDDDIKDGFIRVSFANADSVMVSDKWIKRDAVADGELNVNAAVSLAVVKAIDPKNKDLRVNILEGAAEAYGASVFADDITNLLIELGGGAASLEGSVPVAEARLETVEARLSGVINAETVNVRATPSLEASSVGKLSQGDTVEMDLRTASTDEIKGFVDHWYHMTGPIEGWVFGSLIDKGIANN